MLDHNIKRGLKGEALSSLFLTVQTIHVHQQHNRATIKYKLGLFDSGPTHIKTFLKHY